MDEYRTTEIALEDVQSRLPALQLSLSRVGVTAVEKLIRVRHDGREQLFSAQLECFVDLGSRQKGAHMSRFEEVVNDAIGEVILGESAFRAETLAQLIAEQRARAAGRADRRGHDHRALPGAQAGAGVGHRDAGDLHAARLRRRRPDRHAPLIGVTATGMTACPCAQTLVQESSRERLIEQGFSDDEIERVFEAVPVATHNQRGIGTLRIGCPEGCETDIDALELVKIVESLDVVGDLRADEALRRGRRGREGPPPPALRRGLRARDDRRRARQRSPASATTRSSPPGRRTSSRSTSTTSWPSASACSASCAHELATGEPSEHHVSMREWLDGAGSGDSTPRSR